MQAKQDMQVTMQAQSYIKKYARDAKKHTRESEKNKNEAYTSVARPKMHTQNVILFYKQQRDSQTWVRCFIHRLISPMHQT